MKNNFSFFSSHLAKHALWATVGSLCLLLSGNLHAADIDLSEFFVNGIVTHDDPDDSSSKKITFQSGAQLVNGSDYLLYASAVNNTGNNKNSCPYSSSTTNRKCDTDKDHDPKSALTLTDFSISGDDYATEYQQDENYQETDDSWKLTLSPSEYGSVTLTGSNPTLTFDSDSVGNDALYQINSLNLYNGTVNFESGYYWIENLSINSGVTVNFNLEADERVVLIVKNSFTIYNDLNTNGDANQLVIINYDDLTLNSNKTVNGFLYADDTLTLNSASTVNGAVAGQSVQLKSSGSKVIFNDSAPTINLELDALPEPVIDYHFDKLNSSAEFADYSDNSLNGTPIGDTTTSINAGQVCKAATFDGDGDYIDASGIDDYLSTTASLSFWTKSSQTGSNTAWDAPGITGVEEYGGGDDIFWGYIDKNNHIQIKKGNGNSVSSTTNINDGQWHHIVLTRDSSTGTVQVFVNGQLEKSNTSTTGDVGKSFSSIGRIEDTRTTTSSDYSEYFNGQIDELLIFDSVLSASDIETIYSNQNAGNNYDGSERVCPTEEEINHYEIIHDDSGLTCAEEPITIKACADSSCSDFDSSKNTTVTLQVNDGDSQTVTITDGVSSGVTISYTDTENPAVLSLKSSSYQCLSSTSKTSCEIDFASAGFIFSSESAANTDIANQIAASPFTIYLRAVEDDDGSDDSSVDGVCTALFSDTQTISLSKTNIAPTDSSSLDFTIEDPDSTITDTYSDVALEFDDNGEATLTNATYFDAGQIQLNATYTTSENVTLTGESNKFWVSPSYLTVTASSDSEAKNLIDGASADSTTTHKAGENFTLTVSAHNSEDTVTPNYSPGNIQLKLTRTGPVDIDNDGDDDGDDGTLTYADEENLSSSTSASFSDAANFTSFSGGVSTFNSAQYSEVGLITLDIQDSNYNSASSDEDKIVVSAAEINIGRFIPDHFTLSANDVSYVSGSDMKMSYMDQPNIALSYTLTAQTSAGVTTQNYIGDYVKATVAIQAENDNDGNNLATRLSGSSASWESGIYAASNELWTFSRPDSGIDGPYDNLLFAIYVSDSDDVALNDLDTNVNNSDDCDSAANCTAKMLDETESIVRFGRWNIDNSYGAETSDLRIPMQVQYWDGSDFTTNTLDNFTTFSAANATLDYSSSGNSTMLEDGATSVSGNGTFEDGETQSLILAAPGSDNTGSVTVEHEAPIWLQYNWDNGSDYSDDPSALATFGLYRGNDRVVYRGEVFD